METLVRFIIKLIGFIIAFILCAWIFLDVKPVDSWDKITGKIKSLYSSTTENTSATIQSASNLSETLVEKTNEKISNMGQSASEAVQNTTSANTF